MPHIRKKAIEGLDIGDTFSVSRTFIEQDVIRFGAISRDYNPVHYDERFAKVKNFITDIDERGRAKAEAVFTNEYDITVLEAVVTGIVPGAQEKQVMQDMLAKGDPTNKVSR